MNLHQDRACLGKGVIIAGLSSHIFLLKSSIWVLWSKTKIKLFATNNSLWFWQQNNHGYTQKNQSLHVNSDAGSVMILDYKLPADFKWLLLPWSYNWVMDGSSGRANDPKHTSKSTENGSMTSEWSFRYEHWKHVMQTGDENPKERTLMDLVSYSLFCRGNLRSNFCKTEYKYSAIQCWGGDIKQSTQW